MEESVEKRLEGGDAGESEDAGAAATSDKKKKKKKKPSEKPKDEKKKEPTKKTGPSKKLLAAKMEEIQRIKREEEELERLEEEKERQREEAEAARLEKLRLEQERKDKKRQKQKEKIAREKAEGTWMSAAQKQKQQRALDMLKAKGLDQPLVGAHEVGCEKKARLGTRIRTKKQNQLNKEPSADGELNSEESPQEPKNDDSSKQIIDTVTPTEPKEEWDQDSSEEGDEEVSKGSSSETKEQPPSENGNSRAQSVEIPDPESDSGGKDSDDDSEGSDDSEEEEHHEREADPKKDKAEVRIQKRREANEKARSLKHLRCPVVCVLGHVDTGKTKILDKLRRTNVQDGEAGGITQQIGATNVPIEAIREQSKLVRNFEELELKIPGLLIIDTPGHESFSNLRSRGSSLCDIAILVVDIMHNLEPQTIESINLLKAKKTPFVVALNKIDRLYDWQSTIGRKDIRDVLKLQPPNTILEFEKRTKEVILAFAEQSLNAALFYENPDPKSYISMIPTSAATGEGMGNLMALIVELSQSMLAKRLMFSEELQATVLEVKMIPGLGTTIDVILLNGTMREGDTLVLAGTDGPITTQIRSLLTPQPMKELRVKNTYMEFKEIKGAIGVKVAGKDLEKAIAGLNLQIAYHPDEVDICREEVNRELKSALNSIRLQDRGVFVQASTLGSLEALLEFLKQSKIPYAGIRIGPVVKKDVMKASIMLEHDSQYATILAFDVKIEKDAQDLADNLGVRIFQADIIYHLFDKFMAYRDELKAKKRDEFKHIAVFPCKLKILPQFIFNTRDPIVVGVSVEAGTLKDGTPICVPTREFLEIGVVTSIEVNHKQMESATKGQEVCIKIDPVPGQAPKLLGRHFEETDILVSKITRESIDACKEYFRTDLSKTDWQLMVELKKMFEIM